MESPISPASSSPSSTLVVYCNLQVFPPRKMPAAERLDVWRRVNEVFEEFIGNDPWNDLFLLSDKIGMIQRRLAWPLRKDDTHKSRNGSLML
ncbi:unnamed protein product [Cuscuta campestris]|uniref:Uncharacterized protein n=1 Tax=Cuscuta campestris TaxID=132261 RepID=A0A484M3L6_9ASTE|nr:unnamed protein product [Cuscuta campestris]